MASPPSFPNIRSRGYIKTQQIVSRRATSHGKNDFRWRLPTHGGKSGNLRRFGGWKLHAVVLDKKNWQTGARNADGIDFWRRFSTDEQNRTKNTKYDQQSEALMQIKLLLTLEE